MLDEQRAEPQPDRPGPVVVVPVPLVLQDIEQIVLAHDPARHEDVAETPPSWAAERGDLEDGRIGH